MTLERPLVLLTGYSRGIGRATALTLATRGVTLALFGRDTAAAQETAAQLRAARASFRVYDVELAEPRAIALAVAELLATQGTPFAVINNAGVIERQDVEALSLESWERQFAVNLRAPFLLVKGLVSAMKARGTGRFVQVGSIASTLGTANASAYCATKWGLVGFTKSLAEELRDTGLSAVTVLPGSVDTEMLRGSGFVPRMTPADVAKTLVFFALDAPVSHNGAVIEMFGT
jgi:3-oxoacyl-[acyl-carrier protein] reductase